jgi:formamidopyrimidine-DNA glycosylase
VPELPEVETVRRRLASLVEGARITQARIDDPRLTRPFDPRLVARELVGEHIARVDRRGKYVVVRFSSGRALVAHLRMTGSFRHVPRGSPRGSHVRAVLMMDNGSDVVYRDVRRFGTWELLEEAGIDPYLAARLGPEPLDPALTARRLGARLAGRRAPLKAALLDQRVLAGLGNIYVDEVLWHARIHPLRRAGDLSARELERLFRAVRKVLRLGIERQGATLRDYAQPDGSSGAMQNEFRAYGRAEKPCDRCGTPLERLIVGGRGTTFCPICQAPAATT